MILKHLKFSLPDTLVICFKKHKKPWYMTSRAWSVRSKITLRTSLVTPVGNKSHLIVKLVSFMNMVHFKISSNRRSGSQVLKCVNQFTWVSTWKLKKVIHDTLFKECTFYFHTKWPFIYVPILNNSFNTVSHPKKKHSLRKSGRF